MIAMNPLTDLNLDDIDIGISELRDADNLVARLKSVHRLRVRRRAETIGVLIDAETWRDLQERFRRLEAELEKWEDEALAALAMERLNSPEPWVSGSEQLADELLTDYNEMEAQRRGKQHPSP
jgi:hypothetical protein